MNPYTKSKLKHHEEMLRLYRSKQSLEFKENVTLFTMTDFDYETKPSLETAPELRHYPTVIVPGERVETVVTLMELKYFTGWYFIYSVRSYFSLN